MSGPGTDCPEDYGKFIHNTGKRQSVSHSSRWAARDSGHLEKFAAYYCALNGKGSNVAAEKEREEAR